MAAVAPAAPPAERPDIAELLDRVALLPLEKAAPAHVTCVTGATSVVGAHIVRRLLRAGHTVRAPVRRPDDPEAVGYLRAMPGAAERLTFFKADLMVDGSYDEAMAGCSSVHHVASPFMMVGSKKKLREKLIDPAVKGIENVLASCSRTPTVKRVVVTGTVLAVAADFRPSVRDRGWTVDDTARDASCSETDFPYVHSKVEAEARAEAIAAAQSQWELVTLHIGGAFGPPVSGNGQGFVCLAMKYMRGGAFFPACPPMGFPVQDVRDVAVLHVLAMLADKPRGRYISALKFRTFYELCGALRSDRRTKKFMLPLFTLPSVFRPVAAAAVPLLGFDASLPRRTWGAAPNFDYGRTTADFGLAEQGFEPLGVEPTMVDMELAFQRHKIGGMLTSSMKRYR